MSLTEEKTKTWGNWNLVQGFVQLFPREDAEDYLYLTVSGFSDSSFDMSKLPVFVSHVIHKTAFCRRAAATNNGGREVSRKRVSFSDYHIQQYSDTVPN